MNKFKDFVKNIDWKEFVLSMVIFFIFFIIIIIGMIVNDTWKFLEIEMNMFLVCGFILSFGINLIKQLK